MDASLFFADEKTRGLYLRSWWNGEILLGVALYGKPGEGLFLL